MLPSQKWFPTNRTERAAWFNNFAKQFTVLGSILGFNPAEIQAVTDDNAVVQFLATTINSLERYRKRVIEYRNILCEGRVGATKPTFPLNPNYVLPVDLPTGIYPRLDAVVARVRVAPTYKSEIGAQLGIIPRKHESLAFDEQQPSISVTSLPQSILVVGFVRGRTHGVTVEIQTGKDNDWKQAWKFYGSPVRIEIPRDGNDGPQEVHLRARYVADDLPVGLYSDVVTAVATP